MLVETYRRTLSQLLAKNLKRAGKERNWVSSLEGINQILGHLDFGREGGLHLHLGQNLCKRASSFPLISLDSSLDANYVVLEIYSLL